MRGLLYGVIGGFSSLIMTIVIGYALNLREAADIRGGIVIGTIIISATICCCTGILVDAYKSRKSE